MTSTRSAARQEERVIPEIGVSKKMDYYERKRAQLQQQIDMAVFSLESCDEEVEDIKDRMVNYIEDHLNANPPSRIIGDFHKLLDTWMTAMLESGIDKEEAEYRIVWQRWCLGFLTRMYEDIKDLDANQRDKSYYSQKIKLLECEMKDLAVREKENKRRKRA